MTDDSDESDHEIFVVEEIRNKRLRDGKVR